MKDNPYRQDKEDFEDMLRQYENLRNGTSYSFIEEESFEKLIDYFDEKDDLNAAMEAADFAIDQYPYSSGLQIKKADLLISSRKYNDALDLLEKAELLDRTDINLYILKTEAYLAKDEQQKAAALLEEAIQMFEGEEKLELLFELADVYDDYEEFDKVYNCLAMILEIDPENDEALYKICFWTDFTGRNEEGIKLHKSILDDFPFNELAWFNLGAAYQGLKLYEKAVDAYQYAIAIDEKFDYAHRNLGDAYLRLHKYKESIEALQKVLELTRPEDVVYEAIGHCYDKMKNYAQARFNYRKASHLSPEDSHLYYKIACTYMNEMQWDAAIKNLEAAMRIHRSQPDYNFALAKCYMHLNKVKEAVIHFSAFIKARPRNIKGWKELITCLYKAGFYEEAAEQVDNAIKITENKFILLFYKSAICFALGKSKEAILLLESAMIKDAKHIKQFIELNPALLQNQQVVEVIAKYKKSKK
ncbi:hypothetical protein BH09BAC2_BH09BAC2_17950 [soil metagenome]